MADPMIDTVPTAAEINGDFTNSGVNIYDPATTQPNPNFDPTQPVSANNPQVIRQQFQFNGTPNIINHTSINHAAKLFLHQYVPLATPEMMNCIESMSYG